MSPVRNQKIYNSKWMFEVGSDGRPLKGTRKLNEVLTA